MTPFQSSLNKLQQKIVDSYEQGVTLEQAERLAGEFLGAQLSVSGELKKASLDSRMRKTGVKAIRAAVYLEIVQKSEKKPTEAQITAMLDTDKLIVGEQESFDTAEVEAEELERLYNIFQNAHIYFRGVAKGAFGG